MTVHSILIFCYIILTKYNNKKHSRTECTNQHQQKQEKKKKNKGTVYFDMFGDMETTKSEFKFGDKVRISKHKRKAFALTAIYIQKM